MWFNTTRVVLTAGGAHGGTPLNAFDNAMRAAGVADFNLVRVTSIVPPGIPVSHLADGAAVDGNGLIIPVVYETLGSDRPGCEIAAAVGVGIPPASVRGAGMIFVYSCIGPRADAEGVVSAMVEEGMRNKGYQLHRLEIASATMRVLGPTSVFAAACFCDSDIEPLFPLARSRHLRRENRHRVKRRQSGIPQ